MSIKGLITRDMLEPFFKDNPRLLRAFADQSTIVAETQQVSGLTTQFLREASFLTLGPNDELQNERVLTAGPGLQFAEDAEAGTLTISLSSEAPVVSGGFSVTFYAAAPTNVQLPPTGLLSTTAGAETLSNKALQAPRVVGIGNYADDAAASAGGVPVGGIYRNGSQLMVRVA